METVPNYERILLIADGDAAHRAEIRAIFDAYTILEATNGAQALALMESRGSEITLTVLDLHLPGEDGLSVLHAVRGNPALCDLPVVVVTAAGDVEDEVRALDLGATDVIGRPFDARSMRRRVENIVSRRLLERITAQNRDLKRLKYDVLTGIYNKTSFYEATETLLGTHPGQSYALVRWNIERFKVINDLFGTETGDLLLRTFADRFLKKMRGVGTYGRLEADHFATCMPRELLDPAALEKESVGCFDSLALDYSVVVRFGIYEIDDGNLSIDLMCDRANMAMQTVRGNYLRRYAVYDSALRDALLAEQQIENDMNAALSEGQFCVYLQPVYSVSTDRPVSAEALVRWRHPVRGMMPPSAFIPLFERSGFITKLDTYVWERVCRLIRERLAAELPIVPVSVNVSRLNFYNPNLSDTLIQLAERSGIEPSWLKLEITESAYNDNPQQLLAAMKRLQRYGFEIMMDDFGSGYSSLNMIKDVPVNYLKIDMKFVGDLGMSERAGSVLSSVVRMAKWLEMTVVAEGVETREQLEFLRSIGCDRIQGFFYSPPLPEDGFFSLIEAASGADRPSEPQTLSGEAYALLWNSRGADALLFDSMTDGMGVYELFENRLEVLRVNRAYYEITGGAPDVLFRATTDGLGWVHEADRAQVLDACRAAEASGRIQDLRVRRYHQNGKLLWLRARIRFMGRHGDRKLYYISVSDITALMESEQGAARQRYAEAMFSACEAVFVLDYAADESHVVHHASTGVHEDVFLLPKALEQLMELVHEDDRETVRTMLAREELAVWFRDPSHKTLAFRARIRVHDAFRRYAGILARAPEAGGEEAYLFCLLDLGETGGSRERNLLQSALQPMPFQKIAAKDGESGARRVLIVDDNQINRAMLRKMLSDTYEILEAENGRQAIRTLAQPGVNAAAVLLDIVMPVMDGYAFLEARRNSTALSAVPVIVLSQSDSQDAEIRSLELGANDFLKKPYEPLIIKQRLNNLILLREAMADTYAAETLINNVPGGVAIFELGNGIHTLFASAGVPRISGYAPEAYAAKFGADCFAIVHPDDRQPLLALVRAKKRKREPIETVYRSLRADGSVGYTSIQANFVDVQGSALIYYALLSDVTAQKQMQDELAAAHEKLQIAFRQSQLEMWEYDIRERTVHFSPEQCEKFRVTPLAENAVECIISNGNLHPESQEALRGMITRLENGEPQVTETLRLRDWEHGGYCWNRLTFTAICGKDGRPETAICVSQNVNSEIRSREQYEREAGYRRALTEDAIFFAEFDLDTGEIIDPDPSLFSAYPGLKGKTSGDMLRVLLDKVVYPEDRALCKPVTEPEALVRGALKGVRNIQIEARMCSLSRSFPGYHWASLTVSCIINPATGHVHAFVNVKDINDRKERELHMLDLAQRDPMTGLFNRASFEELAEVAIERGRRDKARSAFLILDLDNFKQVNDTYGHTVGDEVLCEVAARLKGMFRSQDIVARMGGDELGVFMTNIPDASLALAKAVETCRMFGSCLISAQKIPLSCSAGVAVCPEQGETFAELYHNADLALYAAKEGGRSRCCLYDAAHMLPHAIQ